MDARTRRALQAAIREGILEGLEPLMSQLQAVREALITSLEPEPPPEPEPAIECLHPVEKRIDFSAGAVEEWECSPFKGGCGFRFVGRPVGVS